MSPQQAVVYAGSPLDDYLRNVAPEELEGRIDEGRQEGEQDGQDPSTRKSSRNSSGRNSSACTPGSSYSLSSSSSQARQAKRDQHHEHRAGHVSEEEHNLPATTKVCNDICNIVGRY